MIILVMRTMKAKAIFSDSIQFHIPTSILIKEAIFKAVKRITLHIVFLSKIFAAKLQEIDACINFGILHLLLLYVAIYSKGKRKIK